MSHNLRSCRAFLLLAYTAHTRQPLPLSTIGIANRCAPYFVGKEQNMATYIVELTTAIEIEAESPRHAAYKCKLYKKGTPHFVDGNCILGFDEETGEPIFDSDKFTCDEDGVYLMVKPDEGLGTRECDLKGEGSGEL
jgi:hypothetical protein